MNSNFVDRISYPEERDFCDIYVEIKSQDRPLYLYGAGNLASRIIKRLKEEKIHIEGILVDRKAEENMGVLERKIGIHVYDFAEFIAQNDQQCNLIIAFAKGYREKKRIEEISCFNRVYVLDNPIAHHRQIEKDFVRENLDKLNLAYNLFEDEKSKDNFCAFINARINHDAEWVIKASKEDADEFNNDIMTTIQEEVFLDIGAYDGGSIKRFLISNNFKAKKIIGIEPDPNNFQRLSEYMKLNCRSEYELHQIGCWFEKTRLPFNNDEKCSRLDPESDSFIDVDRVDSICGTEEKITLYNMGISVAEYEILKGSSELIRRWHPKIMIFMGSAKEELWQIPAYINELSRDYKIYLRFLTAMPSRIFLYAI